MRGADGRHNASIYVGEVGDGVTEQLLGEVFGRAGTILSVRLCRDAATRRPLGYAYVNYARPEDAMRALDTLNHVELGGRQVRLMPSQRDAFVRRSGVGNVFAKNLDPDRVSNKVLHQAFERFGRVLSAKVATNAAGRSKGYGFVQFEEAECARKAIEGLDGSELCGQLLSVGPFIAAKDRGAEPGSGRFCNLYVRNLGSETDEDALAAAFARFGPISSTVVMRNAGGLSRGFGFVNFETASSAAQAVGEMDGHRHQGVRWRVKRAQRREPEGGAQAARPPRSKLYVRNLPPSCDEAQLCARFQEFGAVGSARLVRDGEGRSRGVGYLHFERPDDAEAAITGMNGRPVSEGAKPLFVTLAQRTQPAPPDPPAQAPPPQGRPSLQLRAADAPGVPGVPAMHVPLPGFVPHNLAFYPAGTQPLYYGPVAVPGMPLAMPPFMGMHRPYHMPTGGPPLYGDPTAAMPGVGYPGPSLAGGSVLGSDLRESYPRHRQQRRVCSRQRASPPPSQAKGLPLAGEAGSQAAPSPSSAPGAQADGSPPAESSPAAQRGQLRGRAAALAGGSPPGSRSARASELLADEAPVAAEVDAHLAARQASEEVAGAN